jgi:hypothetical protein
MNKLYYLEVYLFLREKKDFVPYKTLYETLWDKKVSVDSLGFESELHQVIDDLVGLGYINKNYKGNSYLLKMTAKGLKEFPAFSETL